RARRPRCGARAQRRDGRSLAARRGRPRRRGNRRGRGGQKGPVRATRRARPARHDPRDEHVVHLDHTSRGGHEETGPLHRHALHESRARHGARRGDSRDRDLGRDDRGRPRPRERPRENRAFVPRLSRLRREPHPPADAERGVFRGARGGRNARSGGRHHEARHEPPDGPVGARRLHRPRHVPRDPARPASGARRRQVPPVPAPRADGRRGLAWTEDGTRLLPLRRAGRREAPVICPVCGAVNELDREYCIKCQSKLLVVSGAAEAYEEGTQQEEGVSMDEHLLERVSILEEIVKRSAETLKMLLDALNRQEKNGFVAQTGLLALKDLLERKERMLGGFSGDRRERFKGLLSDAEFAFYALDPDKAVKVLEDAYRLDRGNADLAFFLGETYFNEG